MTTKSSGTRRIVVESNAEWLRAGSISAPRCHRRQFRLLGGCDAHGTSFVLGNLGERIERVDGEQVGGGLGEMHRDENHADRGSLRHPGAQDDRAATRRDADNVSVFDLETGGIRGIDLDARLRIKLVEL